MSQKVSAWLQDLGLGQYTTFFEENAIDWELLPELDQETLKDIGVGVAGHRLRILKATGALMTDQPGIVAGVEARDTKESAPSSLSKEDTTTWSRTPDSNYGVRSFQITYLLLNSSNSPLP